MMKIFPVILAGGAGTRLWPLSREDKPKQFHNITGDGTLFEQTINRLAPLAPDRNIVATAKKYSDITRKELIHHRLSADVLLEPLARNTAAAVLYAAIYLRNLGDDAVMINLPADHYITDNRQFVETIRTAIAEAEKGNLVAIGIKPSYPETGYGYIKAVHEKNGAVPVERFVEKPDLETAKNYCAEGSYFWNSGIYIWKVSTILENFKNLMPEHYRAFEPLLHITADEFLADSPEIWTLKENIFASVASISIDYGIMEKASHRMMIPSDFGWTDLGSWKSIDDIVEPDNDHNRTPVPDDVIFVNSANCSVFSEGGRIAVVGLSDIVVVESDGNILVMNKHEAQAVREVVGIVNSRYRN